jgi:hypothetical protein
MTLQHSALRYTLALGLSLAAATGAVTAYAALTSALTLASGSISIAGSGDGRPALSVAVDYLLDVRVALDEIAVRRTVSR